MATEISMLATMMQQHFTAPIPPQLSSPTPTPAPTSSSATVKAPKIALPKPFDGELRNRETFLHQLNLYIIGRSSDFPTDDSKISFALSLMEGKAQQFANAVIDHWERHWENPALVEKPFEN